MTNDLFSDQSEYYAAGRPSYPPALFDYLASTCDAHKHAWDCATGTGQAAGSLAQYFKQVSATDLSENQIKHAKPTKNVSYHVATAYDSGLEDHSIDLITVCQAVHWFDFDAFYKEAKRVLKPGGTIALVGYALMLFNEPEIDNAIRYAYDHIFWENNYWAPERAHLDNNYDDIPFPFKAYTAPSITLEHSLNREQLITYLGSWSAVATYKKLHENEDPVAQFITPQLLEAWPDATEVKTMSTQLILKVGQ